MIKLERRRTLRSDMTRSQKYRQIMARARKKKPKPPAIISGCNGVAINLTDRHEGPNPYSFACSLRCRHPLHTIKSLSSASNRNDDWIPEDIYKRYTETDSRPASPDQNVLRRSASAPRARSIEPMKCATPEPETKQCQFHQRRVLILDLRRVKSVDAITRQNSLTTGTSFDSTYVDDDGDNRSSSANPDSFFQQLSPRNLSVSRSTTPKNRSAFGGRRKNKSKERSSSPVTYERSSSPKILEGLTLPPLHSSVLTLLGQRPQAVLKSPRTLTQSGNQQEPVTATSAQVTTRKRLRRQGRKPNAKVQKSPRENEREDEGRENDEDPSSPTAKAGLHTQSSKEQIDDPHETQMSAMSNRTDDQDRLSSAKEETEIGSAVVMETAAEINARRLQAYIEESARSLHQVLDEQLVGTEWNSDEMKNIDENIESLKSNFQQYETKFKTGNLRLKESMWLALPRTWSRTSATFGIPTDTRNLAKMTPLEYIQKYIFISEPRKLLYSLVFNRYRGMENPTGKTVRCKTIERALAEVLGRKLSPQECDKLLFEYLQIEKADMEVNEALFRAICAVAERVFGQYSLEDSDECYKCLKYKEKDKSRCHKDQKDHIERADMDFIAAKIKDGRVHPSLVKLMQVVFERG